MESNQEGKRRNDKYNDEDERRQKKTSKRARTKSRSPPDNHERDVRRKRRHSRSKSPEILAKQDKQTIATNEPDAKKEAPTRRAKETDMLNTRTGGAYIPPARLRMMQAQITDKSSIAYQRLAWEALKKSIHGHINKINVGNIGIIIKELLKENIVRGRGLLCRSVIQAQAASPTFTNVYAALVAAVNSRFPNIGELLLKRLVIQFKRGFKRNDKSICISSASFIAHLVNQRVAHEILALELLTLLVETPTDDSVEVAIAFLKECGQKLTEVSSKGVNAIFEMLRNILHEGQLDKRVQYMIEVMFQVWKDGFKDHPALIEELELVPEEEQFTHLMMLDEATDPQDILNVFKFDEKYEENEQKYKTLSKEILGSDAESGEEGSSGESGSEEEDDDEDEEQKEVTIIDNTETNLVALRRTIYLTINSSLDFEECAHKLMKMQLKPGQEVELCHMFLDCCAEQRTYEKFYGLLAQRFCNINRIYIGPFEEIFKDSYSTAHRLDTNRLRNVSKFFAHLLFTDSISWEVLECVKLNEEDTTSSSRIYIKILFQELAEYMGLKKLNDRLKDPTLQEAFSGLFPRDNPKNTRFSINFFTSIGLGGLTDELREHLKQMPKNIPPPAEIKVDSGSSSDDSSDSSTSSDSSSDSSSSGGEEQTTKRSSKKHKNIDKEQETLAEQVAKDKNDRWGHDGYYETYGQGTQRMDLRDHRQAREHFDKSRGFKRHDMDSDNRRGARRDAHEENDNNFRRNRNKDDFRREEKRSQYDEDRNRNDDRNDRSRGGKDDLDRARQNDERNRRNDDRDDLIGEKSRRDYKNGDGDRRTDDRRRKDDDRHREEDRSRKTDDRSYYNDERSRDRTHNIKDREIENRRREKDNRDRLNDDRSNRVTERYQKDDDRVHREEDRRRAYNREQKDDRVRKDGDRSRRDDKISCVGDRSDKVEDREKRNNNRTKTYDDRYYEDDRLRENANRQQKDIRSTKTDNGEHRTDSTQKRGQKEDRRSDKFRREDIDESRGRNKTVLDKSERGNNRKHKDDRKLRDSRNENNVSDEEVHDSREDKYEIDKEERHNGEKNAHQKHKKESKTKNSKKEKKKKDKKAKKHTRNKEIDSSNDSDFDKKKDKLKTSQDTDSDTSSSSSSDDSEVPGRYWDNFDIKGKGDSINEQKIATREMKNREKR